MFGVEPGEIASSFTSIASYDAILVSASQDSWNRGPMKHHAHQHAVCSVAYSPDSTCLASASRDRDVEVWCTRTGALMHMLHTPSPCVFVTFSPDGSKVACTSESNRMCYATQWEAHHLSPSGDIPSMSIPLHTVCTARNWPLHPMTGPYECGMHWMDLSSL